MLRRLLPIAMLLAVAGAACSEGADAGLQAVRDDSRLMFFEVPDEWAVFGTADLEGVIDTPFVAQDPDFTLPVVSRVVFQGVGADAGIPGTDVSSFSYPVGSAVVRTISESQRDIMSRYLLQEMVVPYHGQPAAQEILKEDVSLGDGFAGVQMVVAYTDGTTDRDAAVAFISITDPAVDRMFSIAVGCSLECFQEHQTAILGVVDSWLVNTR